MNRKWLLRAVFTACIAAVLLAQEMISSSTPPSMEIDLNIQDWMHALRRVKRAPTRIRLIAVEWMEFLSSALSTCLILALYQLILCIIRIEDVQPILVVLPGFQPEKASPYFHDLMYPEPLKRRLTKRARYCPILVSSPPIPPPDEGKCITSKTSGREICYPNYSELDTSCTDITGQTRNGLVVPPAVPHATVRAMAFVPPDNLRRLIIQYYRQHGKQIPKNLTNTPRSFLFVKYHCDYGYEFVDEVDTLFCRDKQWDCVPTAMADAATRVCHSTMKESNVDVRRDMCWILMKRLASSLFRKPFVAHWRVAPANLWTKINTPAHAKMDRNAYYCVVLPKYTSNQQAPTKSPQAATSTSLVLLSPILSLKSIGKGPGSAPIIKAARQGRTSIEIRWDPPGIINRPITSYTVYYTNNGNQPIKNWKKIEIKEPTREIEITDLRPDTQYFIRLRANDQLGPASRPFVHIEQGDEMFVPPMQPFTVSCNVTRADPPATITWQHKGRPMNNGEKGTHMTMQNGGIIENTEYSCVAENEAGKSTKRINVTVTGPSAPERIRYQIDGDKVNLNWEQPRITNGPMVGYDILYTDDPSLPPEQWSVLPVNDLNARSAPVPRLQEKTPYTFMIRGRNNLGNGLNSAPFTATTWLGARPPTITIVPEETRIEKDPSNDELSIECEARGVPKPKIIWLWSGQWVEDGKDEFRVYDVSPPDAQDVVRSKLTAQSTTRSGAVTCQAMNNEGSVETRVEVKIKGPGSPPSSIQPSPLNNGFQVTWMPPRRPNGKIKNYIIYYSKNPDSPLSEWESTTVPGDDRSFKAVVDDEDTPYVVKLQAVTDDGPGIISEAYEVTTGRKQIPLNVKLEITNPDVGEETTETIVEPGQLIYFRCIADGRPMPSVSYSWLPVNTSDSGDEPVPIPVKPDENQKHRYNSIEVFSFTPTKRILLCEARNADGSVDDRHVFNVNKPGSPPRDISVIVDPDNRVTVTFQPPKHPNGDIKKYNVYVTGDPSLPIDQWHAFPVEGDLDEPKIVFQRGDLEPDTPYYVKVASVNDNGEGVQSDPTHFNTVSGAPIDAPGDILPTVSVENSVNLSWIAPSQPLGPIKSYTVYFTQDDGSPDESYKDWQRIDVNPLDDGNGAVTLPKDQYDIRPNTPYKIRISATNDLSEGPASDAATFTTGSGEIPPTITLDPAGNIFEVKPKGVVLIKCTATGIPEPRVWWVKENGETVDGNTIQLSDVVKDTSLICMAENNAGKVQENVQAQVMGPGSAPNEFVALAMPNQEINVEWASPDAVNGKVTHYIVHYGEISEGGKEPAEWHTIQVPGDDVNHRLSQLEPKKDFAVKIQAVSDRGPGVVSEPQYIRTLPKAPEPVSDINVQVYPNNSLHVDFTPPNDPESPDKKIKEYVIQYSSDDPVTDETEWKELRYVDPNDGDDKTVIEISGENFNPETKYNLRIIPRGEIDGQPSEPTDFETSDGSKGF
ncbi:hypothetical protein WR25_24062 [Diploscapter pachys]|uniref:Uncharacterized protein n=1 Tax=Diploscapter pachys TaxID=2018661 RepID=A0A2A2L9M5_9BILA|nr:hypothetical protein WR25_24062 [Diploscapter pachys]